MPARRKGRSKGTRKARKKAQKKSSSKKKIAKKTAAKNQEKTWSHVTRIQLAELLGVHPDTVSDYAAQGMPVITRGGRGRQSNYDAVECLAWWRQQQGKNAKEAAQTRAYKAQAELNELKIALQREELYPAQEIIRAGQQQVKSWTAKIRALPRQMVQSGIIPVEGERRVTDLLRGLQSEISNWKTLRDAKQSLRQ